MSSRKTLVSPNSGGRGKRGSFRIPVMPVEWLAGGSWRLPSGRALAEFALQAGFLAPLLFRPGLPAPPQRRPKAASGESARPAPGDGQ